MDDVRSLAQMREKLGALTKQDCWEFHMCRQRLQREQQHEEERGGTDRRCNPGHEGVSLHPAYCMFTEKVHLFFFFNLLLYMSSAAQLSSNYKHNILQHMEISTNLFLFYSSNFLTFIYSTFIL